jgi:hypothetical protein
MTNKSRRRFIERVAATSALALLEACKTSPTGTSVRPTSRVADPTSLPLMIDLIGPMAFRMNPTSKTADVWLPELDFQCPGFTHEAGISTALGGILFPASAANSPTVQCIITGPTPNGSVPVPYLPAGCKIYSVSNPSSDPKAYIHLTLPMPQSVVALMPVFCNIYSNGSPPPSNCPTSYAVGLRFLYGPAGSVSLSINGLTKPIPFDPGPGELQVSLAIEYLPLDYSNDTNDQEAICAFKCLSKLFPNTDLVVDFATCNTAQVAMSSIPFHGQLRNCKAPIILVS